MALYSSQTDEQLLLLLRNSSEAAFTEIYNRYHRAIYAYLNNFVKIPQLSEDLVHEVFIKIWEIRERMEITTSFSAYLYRICHNKALDALKKIAVDQQLRDEVAQWLEPQFPEFGAISRTKQYEQLLETALTLLPPQRQKVFILCREKGKTYNQAAEALGISRNTVKEHMVQSFRFLRHYFSENGETILILILVGEIF